MWLSLPLIFFYILVDFVIILLNSSMASTEGAIFSYAHEKNRNEVGKFLYLIAGYIFLVLFPILAKK